nr:MAG TPA: hypothetical protein [Siphoviridae sp. ctD5s5]
MFEKIKLFFAMRAANKIIENRGKKLSTDKIKEIKEMRLAGFKYKDIAKKLNVSMDTVWKYTKKGK